MTTVKEVKIKQREMRQSMSNFLRESHARLNQIDDDFNFTTSITSSTLFDGYMKFCFSQSVV